MSKRIKKTVVLMLFALTIIFAFCGISALNRQTVFAFAESNDFFMEDGAYCRADSEETSGLRFVAKIKGTYLEGIKSANPDKVVSVGMMLVPNDYIVSDFTKTALVGKQIAEKVFTSFKAEGEYKAFALTLTDIKEYNFTREFSARAFVKVESESLLDGADDFYENYSYYYSGFDNEKNTRNIYGIASSAYGDDAKWEDNTFESELNVMKKYLDGVLSLTEDNEIVQIPHYTSPYKVTLADGIYTIGYVDSSKIATPNVVLIDGVRESVSSLAKKPNVNVNFIASRGATFDGKTVSMPTTTLDGISGAGYAGAVSVVRNNYVGLYDYKVGEFIDFTFTGNNMPQVVLFADKINEEMAGFTINVPGNEYNNIGSSTFNQTETNKGYLISNGFDNGDSNPNTINNGGKNTIAVWGPNRYLPNALNNSYAALMTNALFSNTSANASYKYFTQTEQNDNYAGTQLKYSIGSKEIDGYVHIFATLFVNDNSSFVQKGNTIEVNTNKTVEECYALGTNVLAFATVKGIDEECSFTYSEPYLILNQGVVSSVTANNKTTVELLGQAVVGSSGHISAIGGVNNSYVSFADKYGAGYYVDFEFTGNNMPTVMFFASSQDGNMSNYSGYNGTILNKKGIVVTNGFQCANAENGGYRKFAIWGPQRIYVTDTKTGAYTDFVNRDAKYFYTYSGSDSKDALTQYGLINDTAYRNKNFKYVIGTMDVAGKIYVDATLYDMDNNTVLASVIESTSIDTSSMSDGFIVAYATVKGANNNTTFTYSEPYKTGIAKKGAVKNLDGSFALTTYGLESLSGSGFAAYVSKIDNSYVALNNYGVGKYIDFEFTGNNMPQVVLFADKINGQMAGFTFTGSNGAAAFDQKGTNKGYLISNGFFNHETSNVNNGGKNKIAVWGEDRYTPSALNNCYAYLPSSLFFKGTADVTYKQFTQTEQGTTYQSTLLKYTVGTAEVDGSVHIYATLYQKVDADWVQIGAQIDVNTSKTKAECEALGTNLIAMATCKGNNQVATFKLSDLYTK